MLKTRGNEIEGIVVSDKAKKSVIVEHAYTTFLTKYERSLRKTSRIAAYNPECINARNRGQGAAIRDAKAQQDKVLRCNENIEQG